MRIVGGTYRGHTLEAPKGQNTRPTSDRVRESLFNILAHSISDFSLEGCRVLDLFAGSGALGLEALSRGAAFCLFVENAPEARGAVRQNIETLGLTGVTKVLRRDATALGTPGTLGTYGLVFADPPYRKGLGEKALYSVFENGWLEQNALCVLEEHVSTTLAFPENFQNIDERIYGETKIVIGKFQS